MTRRLLPALLATLALATSCSTLAVAAATVNGEKISEAEVESELDTLRDDPIFGEALKRDPDTRGQRRREILTELIRQKVSEQEAHRLKIRVSRTQIDSLIEREALARGTTVTELLAQENLTQQDARRIAGRAVRRFELVERVVRGVDVDEKTVREAYEGQQESFVEVHLSRITVGDEAEARDVLEQLSGGADFAAVAAEHSTDQLAERGGDMGYVPLSELDVEVQGAIGRAVEGGLTDPIRAQGEEAFEVYRLVDRRTKSFEDVAPQIRAGLTQQERDQRFEEWLADRVRGAKVVVNPKYGRFDRRAQRPGVVPSTGELGP
jgi:parvulin-like peptidyl-prolyl isomerase